MPAILYAGIGVTAALSCLWDVRERRIPNALTFGSAAAALAVHALGGGGAAAATAVAGWTVGLLLFVPWFAAGGMGAGDVKLLAAFGAWLGPLEILWAALFAMAAGGVVALAAAILRGQARRTLTDTWLLAMALRLGAGEGHARHARERSGGIAYALPVAAGVGLTLWLR